MTTRLALGLWLVLPVAALAQTVDMTEAFPPGMVHRVQATVKLTGRLTLPADKDKKAGSLEVHGHSDIAYDERLLPPTADGAGRSIRVYSKMAFRRSLGGQQQHADLRPAARRMVLLRRDYREVPFSPDGPLTFAEIDMVRTDVFVPALAGMLPGKPVRVGDRWTTAKPAVLELTDFETLDEGGLDCRLAEMTDYAGRRVARVIVTGTVRGLSQDGPARHKIEAVYDFEPATRRLAGMSLKGTRELLDADNQVRGRVEGTYAFSRTVLPRGEGLLADAAVAAVPLEPTPETTRLVYASDEPAVRFEYPRRWRLASVRGRQITLDERGGSGILLTVDAASRLPTAAEYLRETREFWAKQQAVLGPYAGPTSANGVERFAVTAEVKGEPLRMEYFVVRQTGGGALVAARLRSADAALLRPEVEAVVRSLTFGGGLPETVPPPKR